MELNKVYLFPAINSEYSVVNKFVEDLNHALNTNGVYSEILKTDRHNPKAFLDKILTDPPDCTLSFNGLLPDTSGHFLCDLIKIPHVALLIDPPTHFLSLTKSPYNIITCVDKDYCKMFLDSKFTHTLFLPHAVSQSLMTAQNQPKTIDVLMLNSYIDPEAIVANWKKNYSKEVQEILKETIEKTKHEYGTSFIFAFVETLDKHTKAGKFIDSQEIEFDSILDELYSFIAATSRIELLKGIHDARVDVYGSDGTGEGWKKHVGDKSNIHYHPQVDFEEALKLMQKAKIVVNCKIESKKGSHERILNAMAAGAAVVTLDTPYIKQHFVDGEEIVLFDLKTPNELNQKINELLSHEAKRASIAMKGRKKVLAEHTWDQRVNILKQELPKFLNEIKQELSMQPK